MDINLVRELVEGGLSDKAAILLVSQLQKVANVSAVDNADGTVTLTVVAA